MRVHSTSLALAGALVQTVAASSGFQKARNFIYVVPDGYGAASQTLARDYYNLMNGIGDVSHPQSSPIGVDPLVS